MVLEITGTEVTGVSHWLITWRCIQTGSCLSINHQWLFPELAVFKLVSRLFLKSVLWLLDNDSSLQLSPPDEVQAGSFLALQPSGSSHSEPCPPSNKLSRKYLQPVLHTITPHSSHNPGSELLKIFLQVANPWKDLPPQDSSFVMVSDPASLIPLAVQLPPPFGDFPLLDLEPLHSCENKTFCLSPECFSACGSDL
ncbi:hypothetical protein AMECASPLE_032870 [Ameca splendens]|uniref:Uncharacterized protein n=1 Tax=Ameca splendens TaxID=208324 RepID=A0ABV0YI43_9TELE